jgi:sugar phosphate isomerase/epimerase
MKPRIRSTHIHDNDGKTDQHLFPFESEGGTVNWKQTMELLRGGGQFPLVLELKEKPGLTSPMETILRIFDRLEEA